MTVKVGCAIYRTGIHRVIGRRLSYPLETDLESWATSINPIVESETMAAVRECRWAAPTTPSAGGNGPEALT